MCLVAAKLLTMNVYTLAVVNGYAVAGGAVLMLGHDKNIMSSNPKLKYFLNETAIQFSLSHPLA